MRFNKTEFMVGLFMLAGILAAVIMALKVAGLVLDSNSDTYTVHAKFDNVGSLKVRAPVRIGGVLVGRVSGISLDKQDLVPVVDMEIFSTYNDISDESKASILTAGIIGEQYIGITPGFYDEEMGTAYLKDGDYIRDTGSAVVLEDLIAKFLYNSAGSDNKSESTAGSAAE